MYFYRSHILLILYNSIWIHFEIPHQISSINFIIPLIMNPRAVNIKLLNILDKEDLLAVIKFWEFMTIKDSPWKSSKLQLTMKKQSVINQNKKSNPPPWKRHDLKREFFPDWTILILSNIRQTLLKEMSSQLSWNFVKMG